QRKTRVAAREALPAAILEAAGEVEEPAAKSLFSAMQRASVVLPGFADAPVETSYVSVGKSRSKQPLVLCLHGFDSSFLEFRRLLPLLSAQGVEAVAVDVLGWGFTALQGVNDFSAGKSIARAHLMAFWEQVLERRPVVLLGASLGGAIAVDFALASPPGAVAGLVLVDGQCYIDGAGPGGALPAGLSRLGIRVLGSRPLRRLANRLAYFDKELATEDAMRVGRLHTLQDGWEDASMGYMRSGGFSVSKRMAEVTAPSLVLWGRQDEILDPKTARPERFVEEMPRAELRYVENCGHVPHLEQPQETALLIAAFTATAAAATKPAAPAAAR
ncbi:unnamed protein product, partial [Phaeothamnion confervicola]